MTDRGRVPFALIGVLLLVVSGTVAVSQHEPVVTEPPVDRAMDRLSAETQSALRSAVHQAARDTAARPVVTVANTTVGRAVNETDSVRDALRLRIYLAARSNLAQLDEPLRSVERSASLPPIEDHDDAAAIREAIERVSLERAGPDGRKLGVTIDGLVLSADREGGLGGERRHSPAFVVDTPILAAHDRVESFEDRLQRRVGRPGLATRVSAVLYPIAWVRGWAQYNGAPIENVVANRHVALATNGALLSEQRRAFGTSDPTGRWVYAGALASVGVQDLVATSNHSVLHRLEAARNRTVRNLTTAGRIAMPRPSDRVPGLSENRTVAVGRAADSASLDALAERTETIARTYAPEVRVRADVDTVNRTVRSRHRASGSWDLEAERTYYHTSVSNQSGAPLVSPGRWHRFEAHSRLVEVRKRTVRSWEKADNTSARTSRVVHSYRTVDLVVEGDHVVGPAPDGPIATVHEFGGPLDGPNLAEARTRVREHVSRNRSGADSLAAAAAIGELDTDPRPVQMARPAGIEEWARADLPALRREVRAIEVTVPMKAVATFQRNVPSMLAERLRDRREALVDAPATYGSVAERARVGVRADYVDRVIDRLEERATQHDAAGEKLDEALSTTDRATEFLTEGAETAASELGPRDDGSRDGLGATVDAAPAYLSRQAVTHAMVPEIPPNRTEYPLVVRNLNGASIPSAGVVDGLFGLLSGPIKTTLPTATQVVETAESLALEETGADHQLDALEAAVATNVDGLRTALVAELAARDLGTERTRADVVETGLRNWTEPTARASALLNGSAADAVHRAAVDRWPDELSNETDRGRLAVALDSAVVERRADDSLRPRLSTVNQTTALVHEQLQSGAERVVSDAGARVEQRASDAVTQRVEKRVAAVAARLPSGVPLVPAPGMWYATVNAWHVQFRGSYVRFAVGLPRGSPERLPAALTYVRENAPAGIDVDGDGDRDPLGRNERITFEAQTVVGVAVPPGPQGVGDVDQREEVSPGWPDPGPTAANATTGWPPGGNATDSNSSAGTTASVDTARSP